MRYLIRLPIGLVVEAICERINPNWEKQRAQKRFAAATRRATAALESLTVSFGNLGREAARSSFLMSCAMRKIADEEQRAIETFSAETCIKEGEPVAESQSGGIHGAR